MSELSRTAITRRALLGSATVAAAALALVGCGSEGAPAASDDATDVTPSENDGSFACGFASGATSLDPSSATTPFAISANRNVVEGLYGLDPHDLTTFCELADGDPVQVDETTFEVSLRADALFSDGSVVTPDDIAASFARANGDAEGWEAGVLSTMLAPIQSITRADDSTVVVTTSVANFSLVRERLALLRVVPASSTREEMDEKPVGSGPWKYSSVGTNSVTLVPNENYNGSFGNTGTELTLRVTKDDDKRVSELLEATTLACEAVPVSDVARLGDAGCVVDAVQGFSSRFLMFNVGREPWGDVRVRQAVMYAINAQAMVDDLFDGHAVVPTSFVPEGYSCYHEAATVYGHDVARARELLSEAGVVPGTIDLRVTDNSQLKAMASQIKEDLDALGFNVVVTQDTSAATYAAIDRGDAYDLLLAAGDPSIFGYDADLLMRWWYGDGTWMRTRCPWYSSEEWVRLLQLMDQALAQSGAEQQDTWNACLDLIAEQCVIYPVLQVQTITASWRDASASPKGRALSGFSGIGSAGLDLLDATSVG